MKDKTQLLGALFGFGMGLFVTLVALRPEHVSVRYLKRGNLLVLEN
jgi:hypothetical protein